MDNLKGKKYMINELLRRALAEKLENRELSQFSRDSGVPHGTLLSFVNGRNKSISLITAEKVLEQLYKEAREGGR